MRLFVLLSFTNNDQSSMSEDDRFRVVLLHHIKHISPIPADMVVTYIGHPSLTILRHSQCALDIFLLASSAEETPCRSTSAPLQGTECTTFKT